MHQLTPEDRSVLFALQQSENALPIRTLTRLTGLTAGCVEETVKRLKSQGSVELVSRFGEICYLSVGDTEAPLMGDFGAWLDLYCSRPGQIEKGDSEGMTFTSCGVVILSSALTASENPQFLARLTTFPEGFVKLVHEIADGLDLWSSGGRFALMQTLEDWEPELADVDGSLHYVTKEFWDALPSPGLKAILDILRAGHRYGGQRDQSLDASGANWLQEWRSSELRSVCN
jgi:hypothetical protein